MQKKTIAIISDNDAGLLLASLLEGDGHAVTLIDTGDNFSARISRSHRALPYYPATGELKSALVTVQSLFAERLLAHETELQPLTFNDHMLQPFVGFGDSKSNAVPMLSLYNVHQSLELDFNFDDGLEKLRSSLKAKILNYSELTQFEILDGKIQKLMINGTQEIVADQFIFMNSPRDLTKLVSIDDLGARTRSHIAKTSVWARITLELQQTAPLFDGRNLIFLLPNQTDQDPCVGLSLANSSVWETYIDNEFCEDAEYVSTVIKNMRRQIRRAFTNLEEKPRELLTVTSSAAADFAWITEAKDVREIAANLLISPTLSTQQPGFAQCIISAASTYELSKSQMLNAVVQSTPSLLASDASC
jgi:hypothetical protein